ncbi:hypothetical protein LD668_24075, partial [Salmonella enterica]|nr:hypothetical protein [Salmonella enterica]
FCHMKHFTDFRARANIISGVYTPLALRDWFRAAPRNPLTTSQLLDITPCHLNMMNNGMLLIRSFPANMTFLI